MVKRYWNKPLIIKEKLENLGFKLYRYYSIEKNDSNHSLFNLKNGCVHFSSPICFNDPFDSNIGSSPLETLGHKKTLIKEKQQMIRIMKILDSVIKTTKKNDYIDFWHCFIKWISFKEGNSVYFFDVLKYLYFLGSNHENEGNICLKGIKKDNPIIDVRNEYNVIEYLISNDATIKYLGIKIKDSCSLDITIDDYIGSIESMFRLVNKNSKDKNAKYERLKNYLLSLKTSIGKSILETFKVACFSERFDSVLMWSHYANKHTGFCIEYDFSKVFSDDDYDKMIAPVIYSKRRVSVVGRRGGVSSGDYKKYDRNLMYAVDCIFTKSSDWSYEKEWRVVASKKDDEVEFNDNIKISKIILGANISDTDEKVLVSIANDKGIPIHKMSIDDSFYKLDIIETV